MTAMTTSPVRTRNGPCVETLTTPYLLLDVERAVTRFRELRDALPGASIHYAVKANDDPRLLAALATAGCSFEVASSAEVRRAVGCGGRAADLVFSNPVKARAEALAAYDAGVRTFVADSPDEVRKIARVAPGSALLVRILTSGGGSDWPLSRKFGISPDLAVDLLSLGASHGLLASGISFHVGSQQRDPEAWREPVAAAAAIFAAARRRGLDPDLLDLGGGFPADHVPDQGRIPPLAAYGAAIRSAVEDSFGDRPPRLLVEPGRGIVGDAGVLVATVIGVAERGGRRWVHLDAGVFTGLVEALDEAIRYRIGTDRDGAGVPTGPCVLAGPTCDSVDVLYENSPVDLPLALREGDRVRFGSAGAYTASYATVGFNGFAPMAVHVR